MEWEVSEMDPSYEDVEKNLPPRLHKSSGLLASNPFVREDGRCVRWEDMSMEEPY